MDKISSIIPGSSRVTSVDMKESSPVRPGTPAFGRGEGVSSLKDASIAAAAVSQSTAQKGAAVAQDMTDWKAKDTAHAALAASLSDKFFNRTKPEPAISDGGGAHAMSSREQAIEDMPMARMRESTDVASHPSGFKTDSMGSLRAATANRPMAAEFFEREDGVMPALEEIPRMKQPEGLYPKGSFIDRSA